METIQITRTTKTLKSGKPFPKIKLGFWKASYYTVEPTEEKGWFKVTYYNQQDQWLMVEYCKKTSSGVLVNRYDIPITQKYIKQSFRKYDGGDDSHSGYRQNSITTMYAKTEGAVHPRYS